MPRLDHRKLEALFSPAANAVSPLQGEGEDIIKRQQQLNFAGILQRVYAGYALLFVTYETLWNKQLVHDRPGAEFLILFAYCMSCLAVYRSIQAYLRLMIVWTLAMAFSGLYRSLHWLEHEDGPIQDRWLVAGLLAVSIAGMVANLVGALAVVPSTSTSRRRRAKMQAKES